MERIKSRIESLERLKNELQEQYHDLIGNRIEVDDETSQKANEIMDHVMNIQNKIDAIKILNCIPLKRPVPESSAKAVVHDEQIIEHLKSIGYSREDFFDELLLLGVDLANRLKVPREPKIEGVVWQWWMQKAFKVLGEVLSNLTSKEDVLEKLRNTAGVYRTAEELRTFLETLKSKS